MTTLRAGAATDVGRVREINEDRYLAADIVFAVADGVGGHQAGEIASQTSVDTLRDQFVAHTTDGFVDAVHRANEAVWQLAQERTDRRGMGTTLAALALVVDGTEEQLAVANVGDSRVYLQSPSEFVQLTRDHSLVEEMVREGRISPAEAQVHPQRSIITRALGMESDIEIDVWQLVPNAGDRYLLCSDGLTNELSDARISSTLRRMGDPAEAARELVRQARAEGGGDNITAVVVDVTDDGQRSEKASAMLARSQTELSATGDAWATPAVRTIPPSDAAPGSTASAGTATDATPAGAGAEAPSCPGAPTATPPPPPAPMTPPAPVAAPPPARRRTSWRMVVFVVALLGVLGSAFVAVRWYATGTYFVRLDGDRVSIYKGRPGGLLWFEPTLIKEPRRPTLAELSPAERQVLRQGRLFPSIRAADIYLNDQLQQAMQRGATTTTVAVPASTTIPGGTPPGPVSSVPPATIGGPPTLPQ